ncbi:HotDog domain-containing protein [Xylariaceae sp. FL1272]|nr:HotDog domain-containing protein [Xylariaceae sp. FL1272]
MGSSNPPKPGVKPHSAPEDHNQAVPDPVAHFKSIPWCSSLLNAGPPTILDTIVPDRRFLPTGESNFVRKTLNSPTTVKACVTFFGVLPRNPEKRKLVSKSAGLLSGGGAENGEDPKNPFLLLNALADIGVDLMSFAGTMHGGMFPVLMDEVMGTAANFHAPNGAYTASFTTEYRQAIQLPQVVLIRGRVTKKVGRKIYAHGTIEDKDGNILCEGHGMWLAMGKDIGRSQL